MLEIHTPTCIQLKGYAYEKIGEAQANHELEELIGLLRAETMHQDEESLIARTAVDEVYEVYLKLLRGHDYCVFQIWATPIGEDHRASFDRAREILDHWLPEQLQREILEDITPLFALRIYACQQAIPYEEMADIFMDELNLAHSWVYSNRLQLTAENKGRREEYLVTPTDTMVPDQLISSVVDDISRVETYFNKIISFYEVYADIYDRLNHIEEEVMAQMDEIAASLDEADVMALKTWLTQISEKYGHLSSISKGLRQDSFSLHSNLNNIKSTLRAWDEERVSNYLPISDVLLNDAEMVSSAYDNLSERIDGIREQLGNMIAMVRTRIELAQQEQSLQQLTDLVQMQKSMDVLEFIFLAAVLLEIFGFLFAALGEIWGREAAAGMGLDYIVTHLWQYPALLTALFVPVIMILSYYIIKLTERLIE
jgi:hypothetical protein